MEVSHVAQSGIRRQLCRVPGALRYSLSPGQLISALQRKPTAMLERAVAAVKEDKAKALDMFNNGAGGFKDRDLYVWCCQRVGRHRNRAALHE